MQQLKCVEDIYVISEVAVRGSTAVSVTAVRWCPPSWLMEVYYYYYYYYYSTVHKAFISNIKKLINSASQFPITGLQLNPTTGCHSCHRRSSIYYIKICRRRFPVFSEVTDTVYYIVVVADNK